MSEKRRDNKSRILNKGEYQNKEGRYEYKYVDANGKRQSVYSWQLTPTDKIPVGKKKGLCLRELEKQIQKDLDDGIDANGARKITLNDMFAMYIQTKVELKESTRTNYIYMYNKDVRNGLGKKKIADIKYSDIKRFYTDLVVKKKFKPNTVGNVHTVLQPVFKLAVRDGYIRTNPTEGIMAELKKSHNWEKPKRHALTVYEQNAFIDFLKKSRVYGHWLPLFTIFLGTGGRVGEIIGLRWEDCDFKENTISINHNLLYRPHNKGKSEFYITTPKTESGKREIPMLKDVRKTLLEQRERQMKEGFNQMIVDGYTGFVFKNRDGGICSAASINRAIKRIYTAYNDEEKINAKKENREPVLISHFSVHNLRHTFCTRLCESEELKIEVIQKIMGHRDITTTMNIYNEVTMDRKKASFEKIEGKMRIC